MNSSKRLAGQWRGLKQGQRVEGWPGDAAATDGGIIISFSVTVSIGSLFWVR